MLPAASGKFTSGTGIAYDPIGDFYISGGSSMVLSETTHAPGNQYLYVDKFTTTGSR